MEKLLHTKQHQPEIIIADKYRIIKKIGNGSFGDIFMGKSLQNGEEVAVKLENSNAQMPQLPHEAKIYRLLNSAAGIPRVRFHGNEGIYNVLVLDLLGPSLEDLFNFCLRNFTIKTILMLVDQMLSRLEVLHLHCLIHRDIKPENFLMGLGHERNKVYLIDFGLAKQYCDPQTHIHIDYRDDYDLIGTARYASVNAHLGIEQSRRDDMESIGYILVYFYRGSLPWQGLRASTRKQKYDKISEKKLSTPLELLCATAPYEFTMYLTYCRSLHFVEQPNYIYLRQIFQVLFCGLNYQYDLLYDWIRLEFERTNSRMHCLNNAAIARYQQKQHQKVAENKST